MKIKLLSLTILFSILSYAQTNRALLVLIDAYPQKSGWGNIHATNDSLIIIPMLFKQGYSPKNIAILSNEKATKRKIIQSLSDIYKRSMKGDYIYIHFSCHGQQMIDNNGDETDGLDEALIPYDAKRRYAKGVYERENHLRNDELEVHLEQLRRRIGKNGHITVILDACHSGTGTRNEEEDEYIRGTSYIFGSEEQQRNMITSKNWRLSHRMDKSLAAITIFSACQDDQINHEYKDINTGLYYGSLSYVFSQAMSLRSGNHAVTSFFNTLKNEMKTIFQNKRWEQIPYYETTNKDQIFRLGVNR